MSIFDVPFENPTQEVHPATPMSYVKHKKASGITPVSYTYGGSKPTNTLFGNSRLIAKIGGFCQIGTVFQVTGVEVYTQKGIKKKAIPL